MHWSIARVLLLLAILLSATANASDIEDRIKRCRSETEDQDRLYCYDRLAGSLKRDDAPAKFEGRHTAVTERFTITKPTILRFRSDGVIFVMYLKDEAGNVVQNLHIGGVGEDTYRIDKPGTYFLQINGAEEWRIWLEPE